ncbi:glutaredoxin family protein [Gracilibacillus phocaeensis]|uniref:glutaredoxin family protein n=1 Tax=Gracilibacillus phocaeensis TaxID=2042304 RepID=UPI0010316601|nr:glutaredoxin family protein [Gracilibacillus phocaeensis]
MKLRLYGKTNCSLCDQAKVTLDILQNHYAFEIEEIDIYTDEELLEQYHLLIPVVTYEQEVIDSGIIDLQTVEDYLKQSVNPNNMTK